MDLLMKEQPSLVVFKRLRHIWECGTNTVQLYIPNPNWSGFLRQGSPATSHGSLCAGHVTPRPDDGKDGASGPMGPNKIGGG